MNTKCPKCGSEDVHKEYFYTILHIISIYAKEMVLSRMNHRKADYYKATENLREVDSSPNIDVQDADTHGNPDDCYFINLAI